MKENYIIKTDEKDNSEGDGSTATIFAFLLLICICLVSVGFSVQSTVDNRELKKRIIKLEQHDSIYQEFYYSLVDSNEKKSFLVVATTCNAVKEQTDNTPDRTSCQFKIDTINPFKQKIIGISRELRREFYYGEKVLVENTHSKLYDGEYTVVDCKAPRMMRSIDIYINKNQLGGRFENVVLKHKY